MGWNPIFTAVGAGNQFLAGHQGNVHVSLSSAYQDFSLFPNAWNPSFTTSVGGTSLVYSNSMLGGGPSPNVGSQGFSYGLAFSMNNIWKTGTSKNQGYSFHNVGNPSYGGWNSQAPARFPFLTMLNFPNLSKLTNNPIRYSPSWPPMPTKLPQTFQSLK